MEWRSKLKIRQAKAVTAKENTRAKGLAHELKAETYLKKHGLKTEARNFSCKHGEIDLVMRDKETIVFVEVRFRKHSHYGGARGSVTWQKQQKVRRSAEQYLVQKKIYEKFPVRFDVMALSAEKYEWIKGAF